MGGAKPTANLQALLKRVVELVMPDLRAYYRVTRKARVVKTYASDGRYWADVQPLRNDESVDEREPVIPRVEIPVIWAGPKRGIVCPPLPGTYCDLTYYDGDPDYPRISNFRWHGMMAPEVEIGGLIIQREPGTHIKIDAANNIICVTPAGRFDTVGGSKAEDVAGGKATKVGGGWSIQVGGDVSVAVGGDVSVAAGGAATVSAPTVTVSAGQINLRGALSVAGAGGGSGESAMVGNLRVTGNIIAGGSIIDSSGNTNNHSHP